MLVHVIYENLMRTYKNIPYVNDKEQETYNYIVKYLKKHDKYPLLAEIIEAFKC